QTRMAVVAFASDSVACASDSVAVWYSASKASASSAQSTSPSASYLACNSLIRFITLSLSVKRRRFVTLCELFNPHLGRERLCPLAADAERFGNVIDQLFRALVLHGSPPFSHRRIQSGVRRQ